MKRKIAFWFYLFFGLSTAAFSADGILPWGQSADQVAWEEFVRISAPSGDPLSQKVEFETWASDEDIYVRNPAQWPLKSAQTLKVLRPSALAKAHSLGKIAPQIFVPGACKDPPQGILAPPAGDLAAAGSGFPTDACIGEEVRRNWASFQYIVGNGLDSRSGLAKAFAKQLKVDLPADAIEFKGDWAKVSDVRRWLGIDEATVRKNYYTSFSSEGGAKTEVALLSFHISTKQIKVWVWSDFEGSMNPGRCDEIGCKDSFGSQTPVIPPNNKPYQSYGGCPKTEVVKSMISNAGLAPVWENYCLKGTQISFVDESGKPTLLGNSIIEPLNAGVPIAKSSCITCHGYASFDKNGKANPFALRLPLQSPVGNLDPEKMKGYLPNDFIWGITLGVKP